MPLPKIQQPLYELTIPSTNKKVKYRPFTVKEEKILLIAQESKDIEQIILSIKQIINNCVTGINVEQLATFDIEYIMMQLRSKSVNNIIDIKIKDPETKEQIDIKLNIDDLQIKRFPNHEKIIKINKDIQLVMEYPKFNSLRLLKNAKPENRQQILFDMMMGCIESVVEGEEVHKLKNFSSTEVTEFIESLSSQNIKDIKNFFDTMPVIKYEKEYIRKDGKKKKFVAEGTETFFI